MSSKKKKNAIWGRASQTVGNGTCQVRMWNSCATGSNSTIYTVSISTYPLEMKAKEGLTRGASTVKWEKRTWRVHSHCSAGVGIFSC